MTPRYLTEPLYQIIDSTTGEPVGDPCPQKDAEVTATALNAAEAAKERSAPLYLFSPGKGWGELWTEIRIGERGLKVRGTARELRITPRLVERLGGAAIDSVPALRNYISRTEQDRIVRAVLEEFLKV